MPDTELPAVHNQVESIAFLVGTWAGAGSGTYPTIDDFTYTERIEITAPPKPFLAYSQQTKRAETGDPLHMETGFFRVPGPGVAELVIAQPTGVAEVLSGSVDGFRIAVRSTQVATTPTAKNIDSVERIIEVDGDVLRYRLLMGAVGQEHQLHLEAELHRL